MNLFNPPSLKKIFFNLKNFIKKNILLFYIYKKLIRPLFIFRDYLKKGEYLRYIEKYLIFYYFFQKKKIDFKFLGYGQLSRYRVQDMKMAIEQQIFKFKKNKIRKTFLLLEIGSYLGESLELWGDLLQSHNVDFQIVSIDPYMPWNSKEDIKDRIIYDINNKQIERIYLYYLHNLSLLKYREKIVHIRKSSNQGLNFLKDINLSFDFIYIDGSHLYENFKSDYILSKQLIFKKNDYSGLLSGDDYEVSINQFSDYKKTKEDFKKFLMENKNRDYIVGLPSGFHPGITLFFSETDDKIIKTKSGFWYKENNNY